MKILSILFLVILLAMTIGCGSQVTSASKSTVPFAELREELDALDARLTNLEEKVLGGLYDNPWSQQSFEARLKALEEKLGVDPRGMENPWAEP